MNPQLDLQLDLQPSSQGLIHTGINMVNNVGNTITVADTVSNTNSYTGTQNHTYTQTAPSTTAPAIETDFIGLPYVTTRPWNIVRVVPALTTQVQTHLMRVASTYVPRYKVETDPRSKKKLPLFPGYLFIQIHPTLPVTHWPFALTELTGVIHTEPLLKFGPVPEAIPYSEIERIDAMVKIGVRPGDAPPQYGDTVEIKVGKCTIEGVLVPGFNKGHAIQFEFLNQWKVLDIASFPLRYLRLIRRRPMSEPIITGIQWDIGSHSANAFLRNDLVGQVIRIGFSPTQQEDMWKPVLPRTANMCAAAPLEQSKLIVELAIKAKMQREGR